jgi:hypothetical protein
MAGRVAVEDNEIMSVQGDQAKAKEKKMLRKFENSLTKTVAEQFMSSQTTFGSVMEFARS